ncbi:MAG TPA: hypothetical protein VFN10_07705 [Thermoanaerobaculia bacterium]|nr:hypothetical protein [Thermoanaerobaculia bacterium]
MKHLEHEDLILAYYDDPAAAGARAHLGSCEACRNELASIATVLDQVTPSATPDPGDDYEARVWSRLQWRLRGEKRRPRVSRWLAWASVAAVATLGVCTGIVWKPRNGKIEVAATSTAPATAAQPVKTTTAAPAETPRDRILMVVVSDHFDESERVLVELANLNPADGTDLRSERARAESLLVSNRLYRTTAKERGEEQVATLLSELEPVLLQLAHAPDDISSDELRKIQKRIESRGLVFKLRVVRAGVRETSPIPQSNTNI